MAVITFDGILSSIADDSDKSRISELAEKYPDLKNGWLRQDDYSRKLDSFKPVKEERDLYKTAVDEWEAWKASNWDETAGRPKLEVFWQNKAEELEAAKGKDMTFDEIKAFTDKALTDKGVVLKTDLEAAIKSKADEIDKGFSGSAYFTAKVAEKVGEHYAEFKKALKVTDLVSKLQEYGTNDLDAAYDKYVSADRLVLKEKADKEFEAKIRKEAKEEAEKELMAKLPNGLPVDQGEPDSMGHFQKSMTHTSEPDALEKATLDGSPTLGRLVAQQYRKDKAGTGA